MFQFIFIGVHLPCHRVVSFKLFHGSRVSSIFVEFYLPGRIPVPYICNNVPFESCIIFSGIDPHLVILWFTGSFVIPAQGIPICKIDPVPFGCSVGTKASLPPGTRHGRRHMFEKVFPNHNVMIGMGMPRHYVGVIGFQYLVKPSVVSHCCTRFLVTEALAVLFR